MHSIISGLHEEIIETTATTTTTGAAAVVVPVSHVESIMDASNSGSSSDAFDGSAEPTVYASENRMPVIIEFNSTIIYIIFVALIMTLLFILPGIRKTRFTSFFGLLTLLTVGASILLALGGSNWLTGTIRLYEVPYSSLTSETITGLLEVNIGLSSANVTLAGKLSSILQPESNSSSITRNNLTPAATKHHPKEPVDYNERFHWDEPDRMASEHIEALRKGLPYPILTVTEFLSQDSDGFSWARQLRQAGYYSRLALYISLASWCMMSFVMCVLPVYLPHMMQITGALLMSSVWLYTLLIQSPKSFAFHVVGSQVEFAFGFTYVTTFVAGAISMFVGLLLFALQLNHPHEQFTIMDTEKYVKDQKAIYGEDLAVKHWASKSKSLAANLVSKSAPITSEKNDNTPTTAAPGRTKTLSRVDSVIIPIADIEENFQKNPDNKTTTTTPTN